MTESFGMSAALFIIGVVLFVHVVGLVARKKLLLKYSLLWMFLSFVFVICAIFPQPIFAIAYAVGFEVPANFIFVLAIVCLLLICLSLSVIASKQAAYSKTLVQEVALVHKQLDEHSTADDHR